MGGNVSYSGDAGRLTALALGIAFGEAFGDKLRAGSGGWPSSRASKRRRKAARATSGSWFGDEGRGLFGPSGACLENFGAMTGRGKH